MIRIERILCPVDFSDASAGAFASAQTLARHYHAKLYAQHVFRFQPLDFECYAPSTYLAERYENARESGRKALEAFLESHADGTVELMPELSDGWAPDAIRSFADDQQVDLIVMATHGRGSTTDKVLRKARCPVVVHGTRGEVPSARKVRDGSVRLRRIVVCTDLAHPSPPTLEYALSVAREHNAELTLLHVVEKVSPALGTEVAIAMADQRLHGLIPSQGAGAARIETAVRAGRAHEEIIQHARDTQADLAIMSVRARNALKLALFGSTMHEVIQRGSCPVLAVHA